jgi:hypothetical protein
MRRAISGATYLHEAMKVDDANRLELLFTPCIDQDVHALFAAAVAQATNTSVESVATDVATATGSNPTAVTNVANTAKSKITRPKLRQPRRSS